MTWECHENTTRDKIVKIQDTQPTHYVSWNNWMKQKADCAKLIVAIKKFYVQIDRYTKYTNLLYYACIAHI